MTVGRVRTRRPHVMSIGEQTYGPSSDKSIEVTWDRFRAPFRPGLRVQPDANVESERPSGTSAELVTQLDRGAVASETLGHKRVDHAQEMVGEHQSQLLRRASERVVSQYD